MEWRERERGLGMPPAWDLWREGFIVGPYSRRARMGMSYGMLIVHRGSRRPVGESAWAIPISAPGTISTTRNGWQKPSHRRPVVADTYRSMTARLRQ